MEALLTIIGILFVIPLFVIYQSFAWGYVASIIYTWFIIPTFPNAPELLWWHLAGIMFFINCFLHNTTKDWIKKEHRDANNGMLVTFINPWVVLLGAWIFKIIFF